MDSSWSTCTPRTSAITYEKLKQLAAGDGIATQVLLVPIVVQRVRSARLSVRSGTREQFVRLGFDIDRASAQQLVIRQVPVPGRGAMLAR